MYILCGYRLISNSISSSGGACSIQLEETVIITGGTLALTMTRVTVYNTEGYVEDLPNLNEARSDHGCGHFVNTDNQVVRGNAILLQYLYP